jgi:hypothetical protein
MLKRVADNVCVCVCVCVCVRVCSFNDCLLYGTPVPGTSSFQFNRWLNLTEIKVGLLPSPLDPQPCSCPPY